MKKEHNIKLSYNANIHTHSLKRIVGYYYKEYVELNEKFENMSVDEYSKMMINKGENAKTEKQRDKISDKNIKTFKVTDRFSIGDLEIKPFSIPHDARDPVSYQIETADARIGTVTDLGYFDEAIIDELKDCDLLYVEANYDLHMLEVGPYPYQLKRRIAGNYGHLCNEMSGQLVGRLLNERLQQVILGHLSKENNFPELALRAVQNELERDFSVTKEALHISVAPRDEARALITL